MLRLLSTLAVAALVLAGCDSAPAPSASADAGSCPSSTVYLSGPSTLAPGAQGQYIASMHPNCVVMVVDWATVGGGTIVSQGGSNGEIVTVQAPASGTFSVRARVEYAFDRFAFGSKSVTVQ